MKKFLYGGKKISKSLALKRIEEEEEELQRRSQSSSSLGYSTKVINNDYSSYDYSSGDSSSSSSSDSGGSGE